MWHHIYVRCMYIRIDLSVFFVTQNVGETSKVEFSLRERRKYPAFCLGWKKPQKEIFQKKSPFLRRGKHSSLLASSKADDEKNVFFFRRRCWKSGKGCQSLFYDFTTNYKNKGVVRSGKNVLLVHSAVLVVLIILVFISVFFVLAASPMTLSVVVLVGGGGDDAE